VVDSKLKTYILTNRERQLLHDFLQKNEFSPCTRMLLVRSANVHVQLISDIFLVLDGLIKFERMRKRERT